MCVEPALQGQKRYGGWDVSLAKKEFFSLSYFSPLSPFPEPSSKDVISNQLAMAFGLSNCRPPLPKCTTLVEADGKGTGKGTSVFFVWIFFSRSFRLPNWEPKRRWWEKIPSARQQTAFFTAVQFCRSGNRETLLLPLFSGAKIGVEEKSSVVRSPPSLLPVPKAPLAKVPTRLMWMITFSAVRDITFWASVSQKA